MAYGNLTHRRVVKLTMQVILKKAIYHLQVTCYDTWQKSPFGELAEKPLDDLAETPPRPPHSRQKFLS